MAQKPISTAAAERMNLVAQDAIWKCLLKAENEARRSWTQKWGFLATPLEEGPLRIFSSQKLLQDTEPMSTSKPKIELPKHFRLQPEIEMDKIIKILPSPPVPKTTQGFIGWRSGVPGLNLSLELDSEIRSCKGAYAKQLGWPEQGIH